MIWSRGLAGMKTEALEMGCRMECRAAEGVNDKTSGSDGTGDSMVIKNLPSFESAELDSYGAL